MRYPYAKIPLKNAPAMSTAARTGGMAPKTARNTAVSIAILASTFASFFFLLKRQDEKRKVTSKLESFEETLLTLPRGGVPLSETLVSDSLSSVPKSPVSTHNAQHFTRTPGWRTSTDGIHAHHATGGHIHQPAPQRDRGDGLAYTKKV
ncbi:hypothetical protein D9757_004463 [Collybiopsis confluens]|uniref:Transmembrane protein n=1 Tax=Collybiopsis confluens TaxID=2823264 RepID=A0A8H5HX26_9AGAR|nr:hypothetical protein D9757_004463 [Collybiopsis confluens]